MFITHVRTKTSLFLVALSTCLLQASWCSVSAEPIATPDLIRSVVLLRSEELRSCATGFFTTNGDIVTNSHVVDLLCPKSICESIAVTQAPALGELASIRIPFLRVESVGNYPSVDLAKLRIIPLAGQNLSLPTGIWKQIDGTEKEATAVYTLGFPGCGPLTLHQGNIVDSNPMQIFTNTKGLRGISGSPLFDQHYHLFGVVNQAQGISGIVHSLFGATFSAQAVNARILNLIDQTPRPTALVQQLALDITDYYRHQVRNKTGMDRLIASSSFAEMVEGLKRQTLEIKEFSKNPFIVLGDYPFPIASSAFESEPDLALLTLAYNLELHGPRLHSFSRLSIDQILTQLQRIDNSSLRSSATELFTFASQSSFPGSELALLLLGLKILLLFGGLALLWGVSVTLVFLKTRGSGLRKTLLTIIIGTVLWPLSFLIWGICQWFCAKKCQA